MAVKQDHLLASLSYCEVENLQEVDQIHLKYTEGERLRTKIGYNFTLPSKENLYSMIAGTHLVTSLKIISNQRTNLLNCCLIYKNKIEQNV